MDLKKTAVTTLAAALLIGATVPATQAFGFGDFFGGKKKMEMNHQRGDGKEFVKMINPSPEVQSLLEQLKSAREAGDEDQVKSIREQIKAHHESEMSKREAELEAAMAGGFESWKSYVTEQKMPEQILEKITAENFPVFVEIHQTRKKLHELEQKLGVEGLGPHHVFMKRK